MQATAPIERLNDDCLELIAAHAVDPRQYNLLAFALTSRRIYRALRPRTNSKLLAAFFHASFDADAPARRLGKHNLTDKALADQFRLRFLTIRRLRCFRPDAASPPRALALLDQYQSDAALLKHDLWTCYLALLEDDHKNADLLFNWAGLPFWLAELVRARSAPPASSWYALTKDDVEVTSLCLWLLWMTTTHDMLERERPRLRDAIQALLYPFVLKGFQYPSSFFPPSIQTLPLPEAPSNARHIPFSLVPPTTVINHFNLNIAISYPPLIPAAMMLTSARTYLTLRANNSRNPSIYEGHNPNDPTGTFIDAALHHWIHSARLTIPPSSAFDPSHDQLHLPAPSLSPLAPSSPPGSNPQSPAPSEHDNDNAEAGDDEDYEESRSEHHDEDWHRLVSCHDPFADEESILRGRVFTPGSLSGDWEGTFFVPDLQTYTRLLMSPPSAPRPNTLECLVFQKPLYCRLKEYHCLEGNVPIRTGAVLHEDEDGVEHLAGEGMMRAWFPEGFVIRNVEDAIIIEDPEEGTSHRYEEWTPDGYLSPSARDLHKTLTSDPADDDSDIAATQVWTRSSPFDGATGARMDDEFASADFHSHGTSSSAPMGVGGTMDMDDRPTGVRHLYEHEEQVMRMDVDESESESEAEDASAEEDEDVRRAVQQGMEEPEMEDYVIYERSGVRDIVIVGETGPQGNAFGHFTFVGRVRSWDGFVLMLRYPTRNELNPHQVGPRWLFHGYIHAGGNFVGRWRDTESGDEVLPLWEGGFALGKRDVAT